MTHDEVHAKYLDISHSVIEDPRMIVNTLLNYFGGADALWFAVHEHITDFEELNMFHLEDYEEMVSCLEQARDKALTQTFEQEFLVNED